MIGPYMDTPTDVSDMTSEKGTNKEPHSTSSVSISSKMSRPTKGSFKKSLKEKLDSTLVTVHHAVNRL